MSIPVINNNLQIGSLDGRVVLGIDRQPFMSMNPHEALMMASMLLKHASTLLAEKSKTETVDKGIEEVFGANEPNHN